MTNLETANAPANVAQQARHDGPTKAAPGKRATRRSAATRRERAAKPAKPKEAAAKRKAAHPGKSKGDVILSLLRRPNGATLATIMAATSWQPHSIRGFVSLLQSKRGLKVTSTKNAAGQRVYPVVK